MKKLLTFVLALVIISGSFASSVEAKTLKQIKAEMDSLAKQMQKLSQQAQALSAAESATTCTSLKVISGTPQGGTAWESLHLDTSSHPEIKEYRIQWFNGGWSPWYVPGENDVDGKVNDDNTPRRIWSYFQDHNYQYKICDPQSAQTSTPPASTTTLPTPPAPAPAPTPTPTVPIITPYVNLKVNGSHNPSPVAYNSVMNVTWDSNMNSCTWWGNYFKNTNGIALTDTNVNQFKPSGSEKVYATSHGADKKTPEYSNPLQIGIQCWSADGNSISDSVDVPVNPKMSNPFITVLSPNGGEDYKAGEQITVKWTSSNIKGNVRIGLIQPYSSSGFHEWVLTTSTSSSGQRKFTLPTTSQWGNMKYGKNFKVIVGVNETQDSSPAEPPFDTSDTLFAINENVSNTPTVPATPMITEIKPTTPTVVPTVALSKILRPGMKNDDYVKSLQRFLIHKGYLRGIADGNYGAMTLQAVRKFQQEKKVKQDGIVGKATWALVQSESPSGIYPSGCISNSGYSSTTGQSCATAVTSSVNATTSKLEGEWYVDGGYVNYPAYEWDNKTLQINNNKLTFDFDSIPSIKDVIKERSCIILNLDNPEKAKDYKGDEALKYKTNCQNHPFSEFYVVGQDLLEISWRVVDPKIEPEQTIFYFKRKS